MRSLLNFTLCLVLFACTQSSKPGQQGQQGQQGSEETKDNTQLIKEINERLHVAMGNESVIQLAEEHGHIYALKNDDDELEFYFEMGCDSEGWPMAGVAYYFYNEKVIGYGYIQCDGCIGEDVSSRLKSLVIKQYKKPEDLDEWGILWSISEPIAKLEKEGSKILKKNLEVSDYDDGDFGVSIQTLSGNIYSNNENGLETYLSFKESYSDNKGVMTLSQLGCNFVFNLTLEGNQIDAKFFQSTCGRNSSNTSLYYEPNNNTISMFIDGQKFTFYPEF